MSFSKSAIICRPNLTGIVTAFYRGIPLNEYFLSESYAGADDVNLLQAA
ncbi:MAG: hypothetical protein ACI965_002428 [Paraglaciecola sp.]